MSLPTTLTVGSHTLTLEYSGDSTYSAGTDSSVTATVSKDAATVSTTHEPEPVTVGQNHSLKIDVSGSAARPTGTATIKEGTTTLGTTPLIDGKATFALPKTMSAGTHTLTVRLQR